MPDTTLVPNHKVQPYTSDELVSRINEQSIDTNRLAATLYSVMDSVKALAAWANGQIQEQGGGTVATIEPIVDAKKPARGR